MKIRSTSSWSLEEIRDYLATTDIPMRLAFLSANGSPLICSLWYDFDGRSIWCATQKGAKVVQRLRVSPRCGFEIAGDQPPYRGVRGQGLASIQAERGASVLEALIDRYLGTRDTSFARWLLSRTDDEIAIRIDVEWFNAWDFSRRMHAAVPPT